MRTPQALLPSRPAAQPRLLRGGPDTAAVALRLRTITPVLGGAAQTRQIDQIDVIRAPTLRGHLRSWWRALQRLAPGSDAATLARAERALFGGAGDETGGRSLVEVRVAVERASLTEDESAIGFRSPGAYALWPAREPPAPRWQAGIEFTVHLRAPSARIGEIKDALRAWILFGGYGSRTRRGCGSVTVVARPGCAAPAEFLPATATREGLRALFQRDILQAIDQRLECDLPLLAGAQLLAGAPRRADDALGAWSQALEWLAEFRQGPGATSGPGGPSDHAREAGSRERPGRSNWPEADKVRRLSGPGPFAHAPRHNAAPVWPRAGFGLPIVARFQSRDANRQPYRHPEPRPYEVCWYAREGREWKKRNRLGSPLIVKALPLVDGRLVPIALWLFRGYPDGQVGLADRERGPQSRAAFDLLVAAGDQALFRPLILAGDPGPGRRLRTAFCDWLTKSKKGAVRL